MIDWNPPKSRLLGCMLWFGASVALPILWTAVVLIPTVWLVEHDLLPKGASSLSALGLLVIPVLSSLAFGWLALEWRAQRQLASSQASRHSILGKASDIVFGLGAVASTCVIGRLLYWCMFQAHVDGMGYGLIVLFGLPWLFAAGWLPFLGLAALLRRLSDNMTLD